jgi:sulfite reductase (NADPH) hemoprotein beta-component
VARDEIVDSLVWCELIRQWSTFHPEFAFLPRKFKIAVNGAVADRAATYLHDVGLHALKDANGNVGFRVIVGGGMGRTPVIGTVIRDFLPWQHLLTYLDAILRVYNRYGRRDNKYKARIKILVKALGAEAFAQKVDEEWAHLENGPATLIEEEVARIESRFSRPNHASLAAEDAGYRGKLVADKAFSAWAKRNVHEHKVDGYAAVSVSLKKTGVAPGDATADQMDAISDLADQYSFGELRVSHEQNLILADVRQSNLYELWQALRVLGLASPNIGLITNIIACPGGDFCSLANAKSLPVADAIQQKFDDLDFQHDIGELDLNISGCINSCGHHHVGHIGVLGVDKHGEEWYQVTIGGNQGLTRPGAPAALGKVIGPSFARDEVPEVVGKLIEVYLENRDSDAERFVDTAWRIGIEPFKERVYDTHHQTAENRRAA